MSQIDMDGVFSTNHKALDLIPLDHVPSSHAVRVVCRQFSLVIDDSLLPQKDYQTAENHPEYEQLKYIASRQLIESALNNTGEESSLLLLTKSYHFPPTYNGGGKS